MIAVRCLAIRRLAVVVADLEIVRHYVFFPFFSFVILERERAVRFVRVLRIMRDALGAIRGDLGVERRGSIGFASLPRHFRVLVLVLRVARGAARLLDVGADHRDNRVIGHAALTRTIIVQNVTKPKLALLHQLSRKRNRWQGMKAKGDSF